MPLSDLNRDDAVALLAKQDINEIIKPAAANSVALNAFRTTRMSAAQTSMPVLSAIPSAGWVSESATTPEGVKPTSKAAWADKKLVAEEMAVIVPIHENVLADSKFDIWNEIRPLVAAEFGRILDLAVLFGINKPATWTDPALVPGAIAAGNVVEEGSSGVDLAEDINQAFGLVEDDDFDVNSAFTGRFLRSELRGLRDLNNQPIYIDSIRSDGGTAAVYGQDLYYTPSGAWQRDMASMLVGDKTKVVIGIREDMQVKLLDQATLGTGDNQINLAERDMVALRFKFRVAYATAFANPQRFGVNGAGATPILENPYPFAVVTPADDEPTPADAEEPVGE